jgi:hypothetical protein
MTRALIHLALTVCAVGALVWVLYLPGALTPALGEPAPVDCAEDDPCWDCATMGNLICGPQLIPAVSIVAPEPQAPVAGSPVTAG